MLRYQRFCRLPQRFYIPEPFLSPAFLIQSGQRALGLCQPARKAASAACACFNERNTSRRSVQMTVWPSTSAVSTSSRS